MRMNERMKKALSALLCVSMLAQNAPVVAFAAQEDCTHHAEHTQECGYVAAVEGKPCTHSHDTAVCGYVEEVKEELCDCTETDENGALVHTEGCSYVAPVAGSDCTHGHEESCGYVAAVEGQACAYRCEICLGNDDEEEEEQETTAPSEPETTEAAEEAEPVEPIELHQTVTIPLELDAAEFDNDEAFAAYVERLFYGDSGASTFGPLVGTRLTGANRKVYDSLKNQIAAVAAGTQASTVFSVSTEEMGITVTVIENELEGPIYVVQDGVASFTAEAQNALIDKFWDAVNLQLIQKALSSDCPYDLYWLDKSVDTGLSFSMGLAQDEAENMYGLITELTMIMYVSRDYQGEDATTVDSSKPAIAAKAAATAQRIAAANNEDKSDYEKLMVYKNYICNAASYNVEAVQDDYERGYGDPWQMIYVFDDNPNTKVVCEGYSKALQYLCDQSGVSCISVGGRCVSEDENGPHMWNIVTLKGENDQEGKNYLVDLTNSDTDTVGQNGELFLAGSAVGSAAEGYIFPTAAGNMGYFYDDLTLSTWGTADLTLAAENYPVPETPEVSECNHSGSTHNTVTDNKDGTHSFTCTVCGNNVTEDCSAYANGFCENGCYQPAEKDGNVYQITNAGNLYWFADLVNSGKDSAKAILENDIVVNTDLSGTNLRSWTPIGRSDWSYFGEFDGNGHTISGLYFDGNAGYVGFIGQLMGTVKNLGIINSYFKGSQRVGAVAGYVKGGAVTNCYHTGTVSGTHYVGGITGFANTGTFTNCYNTGSVTGAQNVGGVAGYAGNVVVTNCYNTGNLIRLPDTSYFLDAGGLVGENHGTVTNCYSTGSLDTGSETVGALVGLNTGTVANCYYLAVGETDDQAARDADAFKSGEVAYLLQGEQSTQVWGQTCGQGLPALGGQKVYYGYVSCAADATQVYSNNPAASPDQPDHSVEYVSGGDGTHKQTCKNCDYATASENCSGGTATCTAKAVCEICKTSYGEKNPDNHASENYTYQNNNNDTHSRVHECGAAVGVPENCSGGEGTATCANGKICEKCNTAYGEADTSNHNEAVNYDSNGFCPNGCYEPAEKDGNVYQITNAGNLYWFADLVNSGKDSAKAILKNDIVVNTDLSGTNLRSWTPIGKSGNSYFGEFDGNGHTISGLYFDEYVDNVGLFGMVMNGTVKDLGIINSYFKGKSNVGGVVGYLRSGTVTNCYNTGTISGNYYIGGVIGRKDNGSVTNCHNTGTVSGTEDVGGVVGFNSSGSVTNCYNTGTVSAPLTNRGSLLVGGLVGRNRGTVTSCYNTGSVEGYTQIGGLVGQIVDYGTVRNCYSTGSVNGSSLVGGLVGQITGYGTVENCYSTGSVSGTGSNVGGIVGTKTIDATIQKCYYQAENETDEIGGITAKNAEAFASGEVAYLLQGEQSDEIWGQTCGQGLPALGGQKVYYGYDTCDTNEPMVYTNQSVSQERPGHSFGGYTSTDENHTRTCSVCSHKETENHTLGYTANGSTITASCSANCGYSGTASVSVTGKTYDGSAVTATVSKTGALAGETIGITYYQNGNERIESAINAGTYTAKITLGNATASVDFTITPATPVIIWDDHTVTYTGAPADLPAVAVTLVNGEGFTGDIICTYDDGKPGRPTDVGTYEVTATVAAAGNYTTASKTIRLTITKAASVLTEAPEARTLTYNGKDQALIAAGTATGGTVKYRLRQNDSFSATIPTGKNAGTYTVYYKVEGDANHNDIAENTVQVIIDKAVAKVNAIPTQKHFRTYAASSSLDLSGFLPQNRGETTYTLGTVTGDFFKAGTAVTNGVLNYAANTTGTDTAGTIQVAVVMENYGNVTLTVNVERVELTAETKHQVAKNDLTTVPAGLTGTAFNTVEAIKTEQKRVLTQFLKEDPKTNVIHYDMKLQFSPDGGNSWVDATHEDFPEEGVTVTLPYPSGTGKNTHNFAVSHIFTAGEEAGTVETPEITYTDSGIEFELSGMSPVSVGWAAKQFNVAVASSSHGKVAVSHTKAPAGTQVTIKITPDSGYRMSTLTVTDAAGNSYILGAVNDDTYIFTMPAANVTVKATFVSNSSAAADTTNPKTGDDFHMAFWGGMMMTTMLGVTALLLNKKKFFQK